MVKFCTEGWTRLKNGVKGLKERQDRKENRLKANKIKEDRAKRFKGQTGYYDKDLKGLSRFAAYVGSRPQSFKDSMIERSKFAQEFNKKNANMTKDWLHNQQSANQARMKANAAATFERADKLKAEMGKLFFTIHVA